jgi:hypothetical protein
MEKKIIKERKSHFPNADRLEDYKLIEIDSDYRFIKKYKYEICEGAAYGILEYDI